MTGEEREKAIAHGKEQLEVFGGEHAEFIKLAIEALEQEPCEDCVSRRAVLNLFNTSDDYNWGMSLLKRKIEKLPPVTPKGVTVTDFADKCRECGAKYGKALKRTRWIPVSERLPDDSREYLVSVTDKEDEDYKQVGVAWFAHPKDYDIQDGEWRELMIDEIVVAWMPKPKPYKAENEPQKNEVGE